MPRMSGEMWSCRDVDVALGEEGRGGGRAPLDVDREDAAAVELARGSPRWRSARSAAAARGARPAATPAPRPRRPEDGPGARPRSRQSTSPLRRAPTTMRTGLRPSAWRTVSAGRSARKRAGADEDAVAEGAHAVGVEQVLGAADPLRVAAAGGDPAVERLREVADGERAAGPPGVHGRQCSRARRSRAAPRRPVAGRHA